MAESVDHSTATATVAVEVQAMSLDPSTTLTKDALRSSSGELTLDEKFELVRSIGEECITDEELRNLLAKKPNPTCYDGFEPSGRMHIAQGVVKVINVNKLLKAGCTVKIWIADWFAQLNNKMGGDLKKIQTTGRYLIEIWKAVGMNVDKVEFVWTSEEINKRADEYWPLVMDIARRNTLPRIMRCGQIMGRTEQEELSAAQIMYPCMQCADIFFLKADICQLGMDQRKVNVLAREYCDSIKRKNKPIILSHHMLPGLQQGQEKMSKSDPSSSIFMEDEEAEVNLKIKKAYCPPGIVEGNPCLEYIKYITFPWFGKFEVLRDEKNGGNRTFTSVEELFNEYTSGKLHPGDLKPALSKALNNILQPVRDHFKNNAEARDLLRAVKYRKMDPAAESSLSASAVHSKKRKTTDGPALSSKIIFTTPLLLSNQPHEPDAQHTVAVDEMQELLFRERTRMALDINPAYISRLENRRELGFYTNPANRRLAFTTLDLNVTEFRRCITQVLTRALLVRYYDRSNLRDSEITAEVAIVVPLTVSACMCAVYSKLRAIHLTHGCLSTRYPTPPQYNKEIELPLPLAIAIQELGIFQTANLPQNVILAPTYPEATQYEGRAEDQFNITDYQTYIPVFKDLGIPCKSVDPNIKKGSAWWTYHIRNSEGTTDLICTIPPTCYTELAASLRMLFLATQQDNTLCSEIVTWPTELPDYGTHLRESPPNSNTRAFLALCHGPKEEWSLGHA